MLYKNWRKARRRANHMVNKVHRLEQENAHLRSDIERLHDLTESLQDMLLQARLGVPVQTLGANDPLPAGAVSLDEVIHWSGSRAIANGARMLQELDEQIKREKGQQP